MRFEEFLAHTAKSRQPVILLEGTRALPAAETPKLVELGRMLALRVPHALFRSGNAPGSDQAFADGVASVSAGKLEIVLPYPEHRGSSMPPGAFSTAISDVPDNALRKLAEITGRATPHHMPLARKYSLSRSRLPPKPAAIIRLIMRDTLKVVGDPATDLAPATIGIFRENPESPEVGGTGHTIRCCHELGVPVVLSRDWCEWISGHAEGD
ncbi:MAG TPA: hypothetical protein PLU30_00010 [Verrucomicrobiae bacterium]|nr:hypothetical protein [Verrucomicrobiae bacterium]